jgi:hypothetical protein
VIVRIEYPAAGQLAITRDRFLAVVMTRNAAPLARLPSQIAEVSNYAARNHQLCHDNSTANGMHP